ncbi:Mitogen-activated protein kinase kinase kinase NPK1-like protein [Drosera capensis]
MQDLIGSVRRSLVFRPTADDAGFTGIANKIGSTFRKSRIGIFARVPGLTPSPSKENMNPVREEEAAPIRWRKGELIGCGAFGRVYMGMNLDSGELLAVKQVSIAANCASKERTQAHVRELEEEVKLLKNLSHPNIVRYLGTAREEEALNILLEFVPGGSISSLLGKFGSFPESVIRMYTKQLLLGLEYLHKNGIMHRDIKGANILVDNKGCIKLADFGASKKVVELATMTGAKSMKGTPYWMAPEVILQTGHSFSADIWSVGCTVIEMATGKPPWSQQYQEVAALFHIGTTKSHPPIPEHLSADAKDFLLKCLQKEPNLRASAGDLLQHPFVVADHRESLHVLRPPVLAGAGNQLLKPATNHADHNRAYFGPRMGDKDLKSIPDMGSVRYSTVYPENPSTTGPAWGMNSTDDDMCQIDDKDEFAIHTPENMNSGLVSVDCTKSFNPMCEPTDEWSCKFDRSSTPKGEANLRNSEASGVAGTSGTLLGEFTFPSEQVADDEEEVTESKIQAFLDEKALDLKKLQSPLVEFYNTLNAASPNAFAAIDGDTDGLNLPTQSKSPIRLPSRRLSKALNAAKAVSPVRHSKRISAGNRMSERPLKEIQSPKPPEWKELLHVAEQSVTSSGSPSLETQKKKWVEELAQELERGREILRQAGVGGKTSSPNNNRIVSRPREKLGFASPAK